MTETKDLYAVDGCVFTEGNFIGLSDRFKNSYLTAFFLTTPGETEGYRECTSKIGGLYNSADAPGSDSISVANGQDRRATADSHSKTNFFTRQRKTR